MSRRCVESPVQAGLILAVAGILAFSVAGLGRAAQGDDYPDEQRAALAYYESWDERWLNGPVEYLVLNDERDLWDTLETPEQRQAFKTWFWARRNQDPRAEENKVRSEFYERVALTNKRFRGFPKGWKSDRGRVWVIVGRPDGMRRSTAQQLFGVNMSAEFEVWTYFTVGGTVSRAFSTNSGEYRVYFIEERIGNLEIFDYQFGAGSWPLDLRRVFDFVGEALVFDPQLEFDPGATDGAFVRSVSESNMPFEVLTEEWGDLGAGGTAVFPMQVALRDLLFENDGGTYVARLEVGAELDPQNGGDKLQVAQRWNVSLPQQLLAELGTGTLLSVLTLDAPPGEYGARVGITQPVAASQGQWEGSVEIESGESVAATASVGRMSIPIDAAGTQQLGLVAPRDGRFPPASTVHILVWVRGASIAWRRGCQNGVRRWHVAELGPGFLQVARWSGGPLGHRDAPAGCGDGRLRAARQSRVVLRCPARAGEDRQVACIVGSSGAMLASVRVPASGIPTASPGSSLIMRLRYEQIDIIANHVVRGLAKRGMFEVEKPDEIEKVVAKVIAEDLRVEDDLNEEVRELMRQHMDQIRRADVEYHEMFKVIKSKLAKERNIIL